MLHNLNYLIVILKGFITVGSNFFLVGLDLFPIIIGALCTRILLLDVFLTNHSVENMVAEVTLHNNIEMPKNCPKIAKSCPKIAQKLPKIVQN